MAAPAVLVVDDDSDLRDTLTVVLEHEGYVVRCAENGAQALVAIHRSNPNAVVLDLSMPVMSGWELLAIVREDSDLCRVPMIVLSGMRAPPGVTCLVKPVSAEELVATVERVRRH
jgi:two-component system, response regulator, stage 0 sporulation protein F